MPTWEETKRAGQTGFFRQGDSIEAAQESVDTFYRQIINKGYMSPMEGDRDITHQIIDNVYEPTKGDWLEYEQYLDGTLPEQEKQGIDVDPEK